MNIHLIRTPEYKSASLVEVHNLLNSHHGPLNFITSSFSFNRSRNKFSLDQKVLSWEYIFNLTREYRRIRKVSRNDFVILLTSIPNQLNWFSHFDKDKNIFVHTGDWEELYKLSHHKYPVAYQVIENIIQYLMDVYPQQSINYMHFKNLGCINDFCESKPDILIKLRTADVCKDCTQRIIDMEIDPHLIDQCFQILESLRAQFLFNKNINRFPEQFSIEIKKDFRILIPGMGFKELTLDPLHKVIYFLILANNGKIKLKELKKFRHKLTKMYKIICPTSSPERAKETIDRLIKQDGTFTFNKSKLNSILKNIFGSTASKNFLISSPPFTVNLDSNIADFRF